MDSSITTCPLFSSYPSPLLFLPPGATPAGGWYTIHHLRPLNILHPLGTSLPLRVHNLSLSSPSSFHFHPFLLFTSITRALLITTLLLWLFFFFSKRHASNIRNWFNVLHTISVQYFQTYWCITFWTFDL